MKKVLSIILSLVMVFTMSATAFAAEVEQPAVRESSTTYTGETFYYNAETGEAIAENGEPYAFEEIRFEVPVTTSEDGIATAGDLFEWYLVRGGLSKTSGGIFTWWFNTDCPTSPFDKPNIKVTAQLQGNFTTGSSFSNVGSPVYHTYTTNADYGVNYTWTSTAKTGYYRFKCKW